MIFIPVLAHMKGLSGQNTTFLRSQYELQNRIPASSTLGQEKTATLPSPLPHNATGRLADIQTLHSTVVGRRTGTNNATSGEQGLKVRRGENLLPGSGIVETFFCAPRLLLSTGQPRLQNAANASAPVP
jgi:hypothetical protein